MDHGQMATAQKPLLFWRNPVVRLRHTFLSINANNVRNGRSSSEILMNFGSLSFHCESIVPSSVVTRYLLDISAVSYCFQPWRPTSIGIAHRICGLSRRQRYRQADARMSDLANGRYVLILSFLAPPAHPFIACRS